MNILNNKFLWVTLLAVGCVRAMVPSRGTKIGPKDRMKYLDLIWKIREETDLCDVTKENVCGSVCAACDGTGSLPCRFCGETGFLMLDNTLIGTGNDCPVCGGLGEEECTRCMGAGYIARWHIDDD